MAAQDGCSASSSFHFSGHTDVKELGLYVQDQITKGNWTFNLGVRGDLYNGLSVVREAEPRAGIAYNVKRTNTVLRLSYAHTLESPFNENLVLSSTGCSNPVLFNLLACQAPGASIISPGIRNEYHAGLQQAFGKYFVLSGEYMWKYTHNAYDFSVFGNTPLTFPIAWTNSKIPGFAVRASVPNYHGLTAFVVRRVSRRAFSIRKLAERVRSRGPQAPFFASTTTRSLNKRHTCNIKYRESGCHGSASTGAMTMDSWPVRCPAPAEIARTFWWRPAGRAATP